MSSEFDKIWCVEYDEDSYHHSLEHISFFKYLSNILSNPYFPAFQRTAHRELQDDREWNERSWVVVQFFEKLNEVFDPSVFEKSLDFVPIQKMCRVFGCFRMWIDLERLYLLFFLKIDRIEFQEDRIFFAIYRAYMFLNELLGEYELKEFKYSFLLRVRDEVSKYSKMLEDVLPSYFHGMLKALSKLVPNYLNGDPPGDPKDKQNFRKMAFQKLIRLYVMTNQMEERVKQNVSFQNKYREMREISSIVEDQAVIAKTDSVKRLYDPKVRILEDFKESCHKTGAPFEEEKLESLLNQYYEKQKGKVPSETYYQSIMRSGHNPYEESNYAIYGDSLNVDMKNKKQLEEAEVVEETRVEKPKQKEIIYKNEFLERLETLTHKSAAVTKKDLAKSTQSADRGRKRLQVGAGNLINMKWDYPIPAEGDPMVDADLALTTIHSANQNKNLDNTVLFQKCDDEDQIIKTIMALKTLARKGIRSEAIYQMEKKAMAVHEKPQQGSLLNLKHKCSVNLSSFDTLRKVLQMTSVENKIMKWIKRESVPSYYPRNMDQIREWPSNPLITREKIELAKTHFFL